MKKFLALLLAVLMLIPMGMIATAEESAGAKTSSIKKMAEYVKIIMDSRPVGTRYVQILRNTRVYPIGAEAGIFLDKGNAIVKKCVTNFL